MGRQWDSLRVLGGWTGGLKVNPHDYNHGGFWPTDARAVCRVGRWRRRNPENLRAGADRDPNEHRARPCVSLRRGLLAPIRRAG
jgi:hypothetical protein